ncbi:MAG: acetate kinase [Streptococcaceae bacterium]|jgi:acetate kinase|nr:acetate kinase [Streptococcaceae bacterium]
MSKTIAINAGSSSLKWQLYQMPEEIVIAKGIVERIGLADSIFTIKYGVGQKFEEIQDIPSHELAVQKLLEELINLKIIASFDEITGVGHRVVAGGESFKNSVLITDEVLEKIEDLAELAPLHNPANAAGIRAFKKILPEITSVAVFDTAFHATIPPVNYLYGLPKAYYQDFKIRKYGAHGTSHYYVSREAAEVLGKPLDETKLITAHIGNGGSITAIRHGRSIDTSMGFTPLAGVLMGTRSGDIDASILPFLMEKLGLTDINDAIDILNRKSGLLGLSGISSDMRDIIEARKAGNPDAELAFDVFINRIQKYIGQYFAVLNGADAIVFTAGIGENSTWVRSAIIKGLSWFGVAIDESKNVVGAQGDISAANSKVKVLVIPTDEELVIARDVEKIKNRS